MATQLPVSPIEGQEAEIGLDKYTYTEGVWKKIVVTLLDTSTEQVIDSRKVFEVTPQITNAPSANRDAVNKSYVDSKFATVGLTTDDYQGVYGLNWDETNDTYLRTGSAGYTAIQSRIRRCVLNDDRSVNYYLDEFDSNKKADGTPSVLTGEDGNVMDEIPRFYKSYVYNEAVGVVHEHSISLTQETGYVIDPAFVVEGEEVAVRYLPAYRGTRVGGKLRSISGTYPSVSFTRATGRTEAAAIGAGWHQVDFLLYEAMTLLCIIEYGTMNIQDALGQGRTRLSGGAWVPGSLIGINGLSNNLGNKSGNYTYVGDADNAQADLSFMSYRGCENFFGNIWLFLDGINVYNHVAYINSNPSTFADDIITGDYISSGVTMGAATGYARKLGNSSQGFFPVNVTGGASNVGTTDYYYQAAGARIALVGGHASYLLHAGPLYLHVDLDSGFSYVNVGSGPSC